MRILTMVAMVVLAAPSMAVGAEAQTSAETATTADGRTERTAGNEQAKKEVGVTPDGQSHCTATGHKGRCAIACKAGTAAMCMDGTPPSRHVQMPDSGVPSCECVTPSKSK